MIKSLIRTSVPDGEIAANSNQTRDYVGGCPGRINLNGIFGSTDDDGYAGVLGNPRATDIANGKAVIYVGANKLKLWQGVSGTDPEADTFCPFDTTVVWAIGDDLYIRTMGTYSVWSNYNYDSNVSHGYVTKAPASSTDYMEA